MQTASNTMTYTRHFKSGAHKQKFLKACAGLDISLDQGRIDPRLASEYGDSTHAVPVQKSIPLQVAKSVRSSIKRVKEDKTMWNPTVTNRIKEKASA